MSQINGRWPAIDAQTTSPADDKRSEDRWSSINISVDVGSCKSENMSENIVYVVTVGSRWLAYRTTLHWVIAVTDADARYKSTH